MFGSASCYFFGETASRDYWADALRVAALRDNGLLGIYPLNLVFSFLGKIFICY